MENITARPVGLICLKHFTVRERSFNSNRLLGSVPNAGIQLYPEFLLHLLLPFTVNPENSSQPCGELMELLTDTGTTCGTPDRHRENIWNASQSWGEHVQPLGDMRRIFGTPHRYMENIWNPWRQQRGHIELHTDTEETFRTPHRHMGNMWNSSKTLGEHVEPLTDMGGMCGTPQRHRESTWNSSQTWEEKNGTPQRPKEYMLNSSQTWGEHVEFHYITQQMSSREFPPGLHLIIFSVKCRYRCSCHK